MLNVKWIPAFAGMTTALNAMFKDCRHNDNSTKRNVFLFVILAKTSIHAICHTRENEYPC
ncbi:hypothetical protein AGMMS49990_04120 [Endomicrobiia bacterium]|nr:hypothetical protein AGMMS49990_04120 [Endomicrobiia bacterium]